MSFLLICKRRLYMALNPFSRWSRLSVPSRSLAPGNVVDRTEERTSTSVAKYKAHDRGVVADRQVPLIQRRFFLYSL